MFTLEKTCYGHLLILPIALPYMPWIDHLDRCWSVGTSLMCTFKHQSNGALNMADTRKSRKQAPRVFQVRRTRNQDTVVWVE